MSTNTYKFENVDVTRFSSWQELNTVADTFSRHIERLHRRLSYGLRRMASLLNAPGGYQSAEFTIEDTSLVLSQVTPKMIAEWVGSKAWADDGRVMTFEYAGRLVRIVRCKPGAVELASAVNGFNGLGGLLCDILKPYSLELRDTGLVEVLKDGDEVIDTLEITSNFYNVLGLTYYSLSYYSYNFSGNMDDANTFYSRLTQMSVFTLAAFDINAQGEYVGDPVKLQQQPGLAGLVEYIRRRGAASFPAVPTAAQIRGVDKYLSKLDGYVKSRKVLTQEHQRDKLVKAKFNHAIVEQATGLKRGRGLQKFMDTYENSFASSGEFDFFHLSSTPETIEKKLQDFHAVYRAGQRETAPTSTPEVEMFF